MSTRGCVAVGIPLKWEGLYNHYDSYPGALGSDLWKILVHQGDLADFAARLLACDSWAGFLAAELGSDYKKNLDCAHITSGKPDPLFIEWVYIIDPERGMLHILEHKDVSPDGCWRNQRHPGGPVTLPDRTVDYGHCRYKHMLAASLKLDGDEPDWGKIGCDEKDQEG